MTQRSDRKKKRSTRATAGCMWGLIGMFDFRQSDSPRFLTNPSQRDGQHYDHWYRRRKLKLLTNFKWKHENLNKVNKVELKEAKSARKQVIQNENLKVKQPKHCSRAASEVIELEGNRSPSSTNYMKTNNTFYAGRNVCNDELKLPKYSETEQHDFWELLRNMSNHLDLVSLFKELSSSKKDQETRIDSGSGCHLSPHIPIHHEVNDFSDQPNKEQVQDYFIYQESLYELLKISACNSLSDRRTNAKEISNSEEFRHFLEVLNSNELFRKVFQDPNSHLVNYNQNHLNGTTKKLHAEQSRKTSQKGESLPREDGLSRQCRDLGNDGQIHPCNMNKLVPKDKSLIKPSRADNDSQGPKKIIVLKPHADGTNTAPNPSCSGAPAYSACSLRFDKEKRASFHFSFQEIKKRLKHLIGANGKNQRMITRDGVMHTIPPGSSASASISKLLPPSVKQADTISYHGQEAPLTIDGKRKGSKPKLIEIQPNLEYKVGTIADNRHMDLNTAKVIHHKDRNSNSQMEAKKRLSEFIYDDDDDDDKKLLKVSKSLGKLLSLPEHDRQYPDIEPFLSPRPTNFSLLQGPQETKLNLLQSSSLKLGIPSSLHCSSTLDLQEHQRDSSPIINQIEKSSLTKDTLPLEGGEKDESEVIEEITKTFETTPKDEKKEHAELATEHGHNEVYPCFSLDPCEEKHSPSPINIIIPGPLLIDDDETAKSTSRKPERIGPGTLLEPFFSATAKYKMQPRQIPLEEHFGLGAHLTNSNLCVDDENFKLEYLRALLEASGLCRSGTVDGLQSPNQLLDPSLYDEVETPSEEIPDDLKLFFDCMNEALVETYKKSSDYLPWVSHFSSDPWPFPSGEHLVEEVWKGLNHIFVPQPPATLEQTVKKDLKGSDWTNARYEAQYIGNEVEGSIFEKLLEETMFELWHYSQLPFDI